MGESVVSANITFFSIHDFRYRFLENANSNPNPNRSNTPSTSSLVYYAKQNVNPSSLTREIGTASQRRTSVSALRRTTTTEHRMTVTMAPGASSGCTKAYPIASDAPTTSPSHGDTTHQQGAWGVTQSHTGETLRFDRPTPAPPQVQDQT